MTNRKEKAVDNSVWKMLRLRVFPVLSELTGQMRDLKARVNALERMNNES